MSYTRGEAQVAKDQDSWQVIVAALCLTRGDEDEKEGEMARRPLSLVEGLHTG